jgi:hypothetical protein
MSKVVNYAWYTATSPSLKIYCGVRVKVLGNLINILTLKTEIAIVLTIKDNTLYGMLILHITSNRNTQNPTTATTLQ